MSNHDALVIHCFICFLFLRDRKGLPDRIGNQSSLIMLAYYSSMQLNSSLITFTSYFVHLFIFKGNVD